MISEKGELIFTGWHVAFALAEIYDGHLGAPKKVFREPRHIRNEDILTEDVIFRLERNRDQKKGGRHMSIIARAIARVITLFDPQIRRQKRELKELKRFSKMIDCAHEAGEKFFKEDKTSFGPREIKLFYGELPSPSKDDFRS